jgi:hypothetical protein
MRMDAAAQATANALAKAIGAPLNRITAICAPGG